MRMHRLTPPRFQSTVKVPPPVRRGEPLSKGGFPVIQVPPQLVDQLPALRDGGIGWTPPRSPKVPRPPEQVGLRRISFVYQKHVTTHDFWQVRMTWCETRLALHSFILRSPLVKEEIRPRLATTIRVAWQHIDEFQDPLFRTGLHCLLNDILRGGRTGVITRSKDPLCYAQTAMMYAVTNVFYLTVGPKLAAKMAPSSLAPLDNTWEQGNHCFPYDAYLVDAVLQLQQEGTLTKAALTLPSRRSKGAADACCCLLCRYLHNQANKKNCW